MEHKRVVEKNAENYEDIHKLKSMKTEKEIKKMLIEDGKGEVF
jgi:hypothetical protein